MNNLSKYLFTCIISLGIFALPARAFAAPRVFFDPSTLTVVQNNEFTIQLKIDAEANQVIGSDVVVSYAGADLDVIAITNGNFFSEFNSADNGTDRLELHGFVTSIYQTKTGAGTLATLKFKSVKNSGSSSLSMICSGNGNDTNMISNTGGNLFSSCSPLNLVALTYSGGASATNTPTPTTAPGSTPTPTQIPNQNNIPTCTSITASATNLQGTPQAISFTCSGADAGGDVTAAEFTFGDGTKQLVEKNVGTNGTLTTTHTYTTIGTLGASCRVRDNNNAFSSVPSGCTQNITIRPKPATVTTTSVKKTTTPTIALTAKAPIVSIISVTPYPTLVLMPSPSLYPPEESGREGSSFWWIVGGAISLILAFLLLRKKKPTPPAGGPPPLQMPPIIVQENSAEPPEPPQVV